MHAALGVVDLALEDLEAGGGDHGLQLGNPAGREPAADRERRSVGEGVISGNPLLDAPPVPATITVVRDSNSSRKRPVRRRRWRLAARLLTYPEGRILAVGVGIALLYVAWLVGVLLATPDAFHNYVAMTATHVLFGRAVGMSFGYAQNLGHDVVIPVNMIIETVLVMLFYPLFVFGMKRLLVFGWLKHTMQRIEQAAEANHGTIRRYGIAGLLVFVCFPFRMTGPLVGCIIGYLMGGTFLAIVGWAVALRELHDRLAAYNAYAPMFLVGVLILIAAAAFFLERPGRNRNHKDR